MASENVETIRALFDALNRGDRDAFFAGIAPDGLIDYSESVGPLSGVYRGIDEIRRYVDDMLDTWSDMRWDVESVTELPPDTLVIRNSIQVRNSRTGLEVEAHSGHVWRFADGKAVYMKLFQSHEEALRAAGVEA